jgi:single-strand DNA-binding protein
MAGSTRLRLHFNIKKEKFIMAASFIVGYLGRDPELRYTPQGTAVCNISVATSEKRKDSVGELHEITTWFQVTFFGRQAEVINERLSKGSHLWLEGSLTLNQWTDKDGATRGSLQVRGSDIKFLSPAGEKAGAGARDWADLGLSKIER